MPSNEPSFVPKRHLVEEAFFGDEDDPECRPVRNLWDALELASSKEQHELARAGRKRIKANKNSIADLADALGMRTFRPIWRRPDRARMRKSSERIVVPSGQASSPGSEHEFTGHALVANPHWGIARSHRLGRRLLGLGRGA